MSMTLQDEEAIKNVAAYVDTLTPKVPTDTLEGGNATKGQATYALCLACHGPDAGGNPALKSPSLKYQSDWYMLRQLKKFKEGIRGTNMKDIGGMQMRPMSMTLVDEQAMKDVIAHIRSISPKE
jgi:cytochrome c553